MAGKLKTPFKDFNPPLTTDEFAALKADIKAHGILEKVCIDGNAILKTPGKPRMLKDIEIGDKVLNAHGDYVEVVWKDYGKPAEENEYVELSCGAYSIIATVDHHIGGKAAGEWRIGEEMEFFNDKKCLIEGVKKVGPVLCGDIQLADDSDYIANGFVVTSQIVRIAADAYDTPTAKQAVAA